MQSALTIQSLIWVVLAATVGSLALYRKYVSRAEVDVIHLRDTESAQIPQQQAMEHQLAAIDRWGKILTIVLLVYGVVIACGYMYIAWGATNQPVS
jgi:hypothetical protein